MKRLSLAIASLCVLMTFASCNKEQELVTALKVEVDPATLTFEYVEGATEPATQTVSLVATRDWTATVEGSGVTVSPESGKGSNDPQTITISSEVNKGGNAVAVVTFAAGNKEATVTVNRAGALGNLMTIEEVIASATDAEVETQGTVMAVSTQGIVISDETGSIFVYKASAKVGDVVSVSGKRDFHNSPQISSATVTTVSTVTPEYPEPQVLDGAAADALVKTEKCVYVQYDGMLVKPGDFYNVEIEGASTGIGSIYGPTSDFDLASLANKMVTVTGYYYETSGSVFLNTIITDIKESATPYMIVPNTAISLSADKTAATFSINTNLDWTVSCEADWITDYTASGKGSGDVMITFDANTGEAREAVFTVSAEGVSSVEVRLSQAAPISGAQKATLSFLNWEFGADDWSSSYAAHTVEFDQATVKFAAANKQPSTITDCPVTKGQDIELIMKDGATLSEATFNLVQWGSKAQTADLYTSTDGGATYSAEKVASASDFVLAAAALPAGTNAVKVKFSSTSNQVGLQSIDITYVK